MGYETGTDKHHRGKLTDSPEVERWPSPPRVERSTLCGARSR